MGKRDGRKKKESEEIWEIRILQQNKPTKASPLRKFRRFFNKSK